LICAHRENLPHLRIGRVEYKKRQFEMHLLAFVGSKRFYVYLQKEKSTRR
jgi:hypothetical protein